MNTGFYSLYQLYTTRETERQKEHCGVFPWGRTKILRLVRQKEFPAPVKVGRGNVWKKGVIHRYEELIGAGVALAEAAVRAEAAMG